VDSIDLMTIFILTILLSFSVYLFISQRGLKSLNYLLAVFVFARFGQLLINTLIDNGLVVFVPLLSIIISPLYYVAPAIVYLYTVGFVNNRVRLRKIDWLHFLPGVIILSYNIFWYFSSHKGGNAAFLPLSPFKKSFNVLEDVFFTPDLFFYFKPVMLSIYLFFSFKAFIKFNDVSKSQAVKSKRNFILSFLIMVLILHATNILAVSLRMNDLMFDEQLRPYYWLTFLLQLFFVFLLLHLMLNPRVLYGYILVSVGDKNNIVELKPFKQLKPATSYITDSDHEFMEMFQHYIENEKPYLKPDFQLLDLANHFKMPIHQCSALINSLLGKKFRDLVNYYRVCHFINIYPERSQSLTLEATAFESGFSSMTTFYRAFTKETGQMPLAYFSN
jgi:AraC-like DNA-binding protein